MSHTQHLGPLQEEIVYEEEHNEQTPHEIDEDDEHDARFAYSTEFIDLSGRSMTDIRAIQDCIGLKKLIIRNNKVTSIEALITLENLEYLDIRNNQIRDMTVCFKLPRLKTFLAANNEISDPQLFTQSVIQAKAPITILDMRGNPITARFYPDVTPGQAEDYENYFAGLDVYMQHDEIQLDDKSFVDRLYYRSFLIHKFLKTIDVLDFICVTRGEIKVAVSITESLGSDEHPLGPNILEAFPNEQVSLEYSKSPVAENETFVLSPDQQVLESSQYDVQKDVELYDWRGIETKYEDTYDDYASSWKHSSKKKQSAFAEDRQRTAGVVYDEPTAQGSIDDVGNYALQHEARDTRQADGPSGYETMHGPEIGLIVFPTAGLSKTSLKIRSVYAEIIEAEEKRLAQRRLRLMERLHHYKQAVEDVMDEQLSFVLDRNQRDAAEDRIAALRAVGTLADPGNENSDIYNRLEAIKQRLYGTQARVIKEQSKKDLGRRVNTDQTSESSSGRSTISSQSSQRMDEIQPFEDGDFYENRDKKQQKSKPTTKTSKPTSDDIDELYTRVRQPSRLAQDDHPADESVMTDLRRRMTDTKGRTSSARESRRPPRRYHDEESGESEENGLEYEEAYSDGSPRAYPHQIPASNLVGADRLHLFQQYRYNLMQQAGIKQPNLMKYEQAHRNSRTSSSRPMGIIQISPPRPRPRPKVSSLESPESPYGELPYSQHKPARKPPVRRSPSHQPTHQLHKHLNPQKRAGHHQKKITGKRDAVVSNEETGRMHVGEPAIAEASRTQKQSSVKTMYLRSRGSQTEENIDDHADSELHDESESHTASRSDLSYSQYSSIADETPSHRHGNRHVSTRPSQTEEHGAMKIHPNRFHQHSLHRAHLSHPDDDQSSGSVAHSDVFLRKEIDYERDSSVRREIQSSSTSSISLVHPSREGQSSSSIRSDSNFVDDSMSEKLSRRSFDDFSTSSNSKMHTTQRQPQRDSAHRSHEQKQLHENVDGRPDAPRKSNFTRVVSTSQRNTILHRLMKFGQIPPIAMPSTQDFSLPIIKDLIPEHPEFQACADLVLAENFIQSQSRKSYECLRVCKVYHPKLQQTLARLDHGVNEEGHNLDVMFFGGDYNMILDVMNNGFEKLAQSDGGVLVGRHLSLIDQYALKSYDRKKVPRIITWRAMIVLLKPGNVFDFEGTTEEFATQRHAYCAEAVRQQFHCLRLGYGEINVVLSPERCVPCYLIEYSFTS